MLNITDSCKLDRHNSRPLQIAFQSHEYKLMAGAQDEISVWEDGGYLHILSMEKRLPYVGIETHSKNGEMIDDNFLQESQVEEHLGENWEEMSEQEIVNEMISVYL